MKNLTLIPFAERPDLVAKSVLRALYEAPSALRAEIYVAEIDPAHKGGEDFCTTYDVDPMSGANCVVLEAQRAHQTWRIGTLIPVGHRMDMGGTLRRFENARKISVAPLDDVLAATGMEYGSITVVGLPIDWRILVDSSLAEKEYVFLGSGKVTSKLRIPGSYFEHSGCLLFPGLGIPRPREVGTPS